MLETHLVLYFSFLFLICSFFRILFHYVSLKSSFITFYFGEFYGIFIFSPCATGFYLLSYFVNLYTFFEVDYFQPRFLFPSLSFYENILNVFFYCNLFILSKNFDVLCQNCLEKPQCNLSGCPLLFPSELLSSFIMYYYIIIYYIIYYRCQGKLCIWLYIL